LTPSQLWLRLKRVVNRQGFSYEKLITLKETNPGIGPRIRTVSDLDSKSTTLILILQIHNSGSNPAEDLLQSTIRDQIFTS
jgi:hypothetical protein